MKRLVGVILLSVLAGMSWAAVVTDSGDAGAGTLRQAIADAVDGETITFSGVTSITLTSGQLSIANKSLTISGGGTVTIDGNNASRIFNVSGSNQDTVISGLTIINGKETAQYAHGGGIYFGYGADSTLTLLNCTVEGCSTTNAAGGGGIFADTGNNTAGRLLTLNNCKIDGNFASNGGGIYSFSVMNMQNSVITNNSSTSWGGGVQMYQAAYGTSQWDNVTVVDNQAKYGGGCHFRGTPIMVVNSTFHTNYASSGGGAMMFQYYATSGGLTTNDIVFSNCTFTANSVANDRSGGAVSIEAGTPSFIDSVFTGNVAFYIGGAISMGRGNTSFQPPECLLRGCTLNGNVAGAGGAISTGYGGTKCTIIDCDLYDNRATTVSSVYGGGAISLQNNSASNKTQTIIKDCRIYNNSSTNMGGGVWASHTLTMEDTVVSNNTANIGGGLYTYMLTTYFDDCSINGCTFVDNKATGTGDTAGGIYWRGDKLTISETDFINNESTGNSDAFHFSNGETPFMTISNCTFKGRSGGQKLARFVGPVDLYGCLFYNHTGTSYGVSFENLAGTTSTVINTTFTGMEKTSGYGGGVHAGGTGTLKFYNSTIYDNTSSSRGGGIHSTKTNLYLYSTIIAGNNGTSGYEDIYGQAGAMNTMDHCIYQELSGSFTTTNANIVADPMLAILADNGGPTMTLATKKGSPCREAGSNPLGLAYDQRGEEFTRVFNIVDIGAYEYSPLVFGGIITIR